MSDVPVAFNLLTPLLRGDDAVRYRIYLPAGTELLSRRLSLFPHVPSWVKDEWPELALGRARGKPEEYRDRTDRRRKITEENYRERIMLKSRSS